MVGLWYFWLRADNFWGGFQTGLVFRDPAWCLRKEIYTFNALL